MALNLVFDTSEVVTLAAFLVSLWFTFNLARETKWEKFWTFFFLSSGLFFLNFLAGSVWLQGVFDPLTQLRLQQVGVVFGALTLAAASYGLHKQMRLVREKLSDARPKKR